ncbi:hypothetical protein ABZY36_20845 [Streptomyces sp. NPDC006627]|uniref:hypothetical protein n=1 Tax=Streptomyces sp. NPDC006627 TaxID=3154679 RepID=UPI0033BAD28A
MEPIVKSAEDALSEIETLEFDRFNALDLSLTVAKWSCLTDPAVEEFPTWEAWVTAMQVGAGLFVSGMADEGPVHCRIGTHGEVKIRDPVQERRGPGRSRTPLAIACMAFDADMPIEVESEYLPKAFPQRSWLEEFDT